MLDRENVIQVLRAAAGALQSNSDVLSKVEPPGLIELFGPANTLYANTLNRIADLIESGENFPQH